MENIHYAAGDTIFSEGDESTDCFKIVSGRVEIRLNSPGVMRRGNTEVVATCGPGEIIGEMGAIDGGPRSASAVAITKTICTAYSSEEILDLLENDPKEALSYVRTLIQRVRRSNRKMSWSGRPRG